MKASFNLLPRPERSALVVIDIQERLAAVMPPDEMASVTRNSAIMVETAKEFGLPLVVSEQYPKGLGPTVPELCAVLPPGLQPVPKQSFSLCGEPALQSAFETLGERDLILCGIETHVCVLQTTIDLLRQGRRVFIAADAVCSRAPVNRQLGLNLMQEAGAVIGSTEIFVFGLLGASGSDRFKRIQKLVK